MGNVSRLHQLRISDRGHLKLTDIMVSTQVFVLLACSAALASASPHLGYGAPAGGYGSHASHEVVDAVPHASHEVADSTDAAEEQDTASLYSQVPSVLASAGDVYHSCMATCVNEAVASSAPLPGPPGSYGYGSMAPVQEQAEGEVVAENSPHQTASAYYGGHHL